MPPSDRQDRQDDLYATAESLREDARRIEAIETEKRELHVDDPRVDVLSREAERLAGQIQDKSRAERELSAGGDGEGDSGRGGPRN